MASVQTVRGLQATAVNTGGISQLLSGLIDGRVKVMVENYSIIGSDLAAGSTIIIGGKMPVGANVLAIVLAVSAAQTSLTFQLGDAGSANRYAATGHTGLQTATTPVIIGGKNYVVATAGTDDQIRLLTEGATATAGTLYAFVLYSID